MVAEQHDVQRTEAQHTEAQHTEAQQTGAHHDYSRQNDEHEPFVASVPQQMTDDRLVDKQQLKLATRVSAVGIEIVLAVLVGYFGGRWLDRHLDTTPYLAYLGLACGLFAGFKSLWTIGRRINLDRL
jgi:F0F1-type ATP synthase assembly protein I